MNDIENKKRCFVITPIGKETDPIRRHIDGIIEAAIIPALGDKYEIVVAHKIDAPGTITKQIISEIYNDDLVVANLTDKNPNVMYELAFRHTIGKPVIMICEKDTNLPADVIMERTIFYQNDAKGVLELKESLASAEQAIDFNEKRGPIIEILGDISHDTSVLQNVNKEDKEPLEYIMHRLTKIEDAILTSNRKLETRLVERKLPRERRLALKIEISNTTDAEKAIPLILEAVEREEINITSFEMIANNTKVYIKFIDEKMRPISIIAKLFKEIFEYYGILTIDSVAV